MNYSEENPVINWIAEKLDSLKKLMKRKIDLYEFLPKPRGLGLTSAE